MKIMKIMPTKFIYANINNIFLMLNVFIKNDNMQFAKTYFKCHGG